MNTLRLTQTPAGEGSYHVEVALEAEGQPRQTAAAGFDFSLGAQEAEDLRWYLEDYLQHPHDPAPKIAARVERRIKDIGAALFRAVFQSGDDARDLWATLRLGLSDTRVEIVTGVSGASAVPWELLRDPTTDAPLALRARSFVRAHPQPAQRPPLPRADGDSMRILLVICRPGGDEDVPFRSVAMRILKGLSGGASEVFQLDVLRPPTFERLGEALRHAKSEGRPYHVVHFDGHGMFLDLTELFGSQAGGESDGGDLPEALSDFDPRRYSPRSIYPREPRDGRRGYLAFENPQDAYNLRLVDGPELGGLLAEAGVPVLVMNACRSAHAEPPASPEKASEDKGPHEKVRAFGSLAQEVMDAGVAGVVAMRYNVYVVTAAQFVADLYAALAEGQPFGEAATLGRKKLNDQSLREVAYNPLPLQDWVVPVAYEAAPLTLVPRRRQARNFNVSLEAGQSVAARGSLDPQLPKRPDAGFFGRDGTLLKLDRLFDTQRVVLLHAYAGGGKTATAAEFARWYSLTDGVRGPVLFTSFEHWRTLPRVLDQLGQVFGEALERAGVNWLALEDRQRRSVALDVLRQIPVFWIWDNVEPVAGFPVGAESAWSEEEQRELADFLRDARDTQAKFLLTSRRDERSWLGDLPARVELPPMPMQERVQFARALAERHGRRLGDVDDWRPLLRFTQGNPLTITVLVGQALRDNLQTREQIEAFVIRLRAGESAFEDEESEGRTKSLGASLSYGFEHAFTEQERKQLALLHLFQGFVDVDALRMMGNPDIPESLPELHGLTREVGIALLDRVAEVGLLTAIGEGYYFIHPALPWFFKNLFDTYYPPSPSGSEQWEKSARAFVKGLGMLGDFYHDKYAEGVVTVISALTAEEANMLYARKLARQFGLKLEIVGTMQGLYILYHHMGRRAEWESLVSEIVPDFVDLATEGPLPGLESQWSIVTQYRVHIAQTKLQWGAAERLQRARVEVNRKRAAPIFALPAGEIDDVGRNIIRSLAASLHELGEIQRHLKQPECVASYTESSELAELIKDKMGAAICAFNLGTSYLDIPVMRSLDQAEYWYRHSLERLDKNEVMVRSKCLSQLGAVAFERFQEAREGQRPDQEALRHLNDALRLYSQSLDDTPRDALAELAVKHNALGYIYAEGMNMPSALMHWREALHSYDEMGDLYHAAKVRSNIAIGLTMVERFVDARDYAYAALRNLEAYGDRAAGEMEETRRLIADIEQVLQTRGE
jgi:tetratricopeptide (TPR) repeat protein